MNVLVDTPSSFNDDERKAWRLLQRRAAALADRATLTSAQHPSSSAAAELQALRWVMACAADAEAAAVGLADLGELLRPL